VPAVGIEGFCKRELRAFVLGAVAPHTRLVTDDWPCYRDLPNVRHNAITLGPVAAHIALPWIHRLFSNLKRWGLGVYHGLRKTPTSSTTPMYSCSASIGAARGMPPLTRRRGRGTGGGRHWREDGGITAESI
jgi:hypothetical protein